MPERAARAAEAPAEHGRVEILFFQFFFPPEEIFIHVAAHCTALQGHQLSATLLSRESSGGLQGW